MFAHNFSVRKALRETMNIKLVGFMTMINTAFNKADIHWLAIGKRLRCSACSIKPLHLHPVLRAALSLKGEDLSTERLPRIRLLSSHNQVKQG